MATTLPSEFRLIPARAGLNAVADPQRRNLQAGTAILNFEEVIKFDVESSNTFNRTDLGSDHWWLLEFRQ